MSTAITLSGSDANLASTVFTTWLNEGSNTVTLLLVLGEDAAAMKGRDFSETLLEKSPADYVSVKFLFVPQPSFILPVLKQLTIKVDHSKFTWEDFDDYTVISISPDNNFISDFVTSDALLTRPGKIRTAILRAMSNATLSS